VEEPEHKDVGDTDKSGGDAAPPTTSVHVVAHYARLRLHALAVISSNGDHHALGGQLADNKARDSTGMSVKMPLTRIFQSDLNSVVV